MLSSETLEFFFRNNAYTCLTGRENASQLAQIKFLAAQSNVSTQTSVEQYWEWVWNIRISKLKVFELHVIVTGFFLVKIVWNSQHLGKIEVYIQKSRPSANWQHRWLCWDSMGTTSSSIIGLGDNLFCAMEWHNRSEKSKKIEFTFLQL